MRIMPAEPARARRAPLFAGMSIAIGVGVLGGCDRGAPARAAGRANVLATPTVSIAAAAPRLMTSADVDAELRTAWRDAGVVPTPPADDATWLRRLWIDVAGTLPPPEVVRRFLADEPAVSASSVSSAAPAAPRRGDKRSRAIDELLASPLWADHWTSYWDDVWMGKAARRPDVDAGAFRGWLHDALARDEPWNQVVTQLLTATGRNSAGGAKRDAETNDGKGGAIAGVNGAVNWTLRYQEAPQDMAGAASRTLLGVQIQCAQCHDHKTEKWTQADFQRFAAAFVRTKLVPIDKGKAMGDVKRVEVRDLDHAAPRFGKMGDLEPIAK